MPISNVIVYKPFRIDKRCSVDVGLRKPNYISTETLSSLSIAINILAATLNKKMPYSATAGKWKSDPESVSRPDQHQELISYSDW